MLTFFRNLTDLSLVIEKELFCRPLRFLIFEKRLFPRLCRVHMYDDRAFFVAAPKLWNSLPSNIR